MNSVERVKAICKDRKIPVSRLEKDLGYANGYISQLRKGTFPDNRLVEIASYLETTVEYLLTGAEKTEKPTAALGDELIPGYADLSTENRAKVREYIALLAMSEQKD